MRGEERRSVELFSYIRLDERIPSDHPLRAVRALVNETLETLSGRFEKGALRPVLGGEVLLCRVRTERGVHQSDKLPFVGARRSAGGRSCCFI